MTGIFPPSLLVDAISVSGNNFKIAGLEQNKWWTLHSSVYYWWPWQLSFPQLCCINEDDPWWHKEDWVSYTKLDWISALSGFRLTFIFLFSVMCQIYISRKIKIQGVLWCKNQSRYHISCYTTAQVMFVCLLFERATFVCKPSTFNVQRSTTLVPNYSNLLIIHSDISSPYHSYHVRVLFLTSLHTNVLILSGRCL